MTYTVVTPYSRSNIFGQSIPYSYWPASPSVSPADIIPLPKVVRRASSVGSKGRRSLPSTVLTSSPYKNELKSASSRPKRNDSLKPVGEKKSRKRSEEKGNCQRVCESGNNCSSNRTRSFKRSRSSQGKGKDKNDTTDDAECFVCGETYLETPDDHWIKCDDCDA